jgi:hypothetical protein
MYKLFGSSLRNRRRRVPVFTASRLEGEAAVVALAVLGGLFLHRRPMRALLPRQAHQRARLEWEVAAPADEEVRRRFRRESIPCG